jgi:branched-chain amino acid transport system permease protein
METATLPIAPRSPLAAFVRRWSDHRVLVSLLVLLAFTRLLPYQALAVNVLVYGLFALGFNLLFGYTGMLSFGHAAFFGAGAYGTGIAIARFGVHWLPAMGIGLLFSGVAAAVLGALAIRTRGIYFSMVTLALAQCVYYLFHQAESLSGGENGLRGIALRPMGVGGFRLNLLDPSHKYWFVLGCVGVGVWIFSRIVASPFGGVLEAIRENEQRARACGYDTLRTKWVAFVTSALLCGLAGALDALHLTVVPLDSLHYHTSGLVVMMSLLGGMGTFFGPFVGAAAFLVLEDVLSAATKHWQLFVGSLFMVFVLFFPRGIWGSLLHWSRRWTRT